MQSTNIYFVAFWSYDPETKKVRYIFETRSASEIRQNYDVLTETDGVEVFLPFVVEEDREKFLDIYRKIDAGEQFVETEIKCFAEGEIRDDNNVRYVLMRVRRITDPFSGKNIAYGFAIDTTSRVIHLRKYRHAYRDFTTLAPETIRIVHLDLTANKSYPIEGGRDSNEFRKSYRLKPSFQDADEYFTELISRIDDPILQRQMTPQLNRETMIAIFRSGNEHFDIEYMFRMEDGSRRLLKTRFFLIQNAETYNIEAFVTTLDIDDNRKRDLIMSKVPLMEFDFIALIDVKKKNWELFFTKPGGVHSRMRRTQDFDSARKYASDHFVVPDYRELFDKELRISNLIENLNRDESFSLPFKIREQSAEHSRLVRCYWLDETKKYIIMVQSDVSKLFEREQEQFRNVQRSIQAAEKANKVRAEFVSRISHDIRTPISLVNSMVDFAFKDIDERPKLEEDLNKIKSAGKLLLALVNDVLDISKMESGKINLQPAAFNLTDIVEDINNIFEPSCKQKNIEFIVNRIGEEDSIIADRVRLTQVLLNLISNAVKYSMEDGRVEVSIITIKLSEETCGLELVVTDNGIGMSEEFQKKMFVPFEQDYQNPLRDPKTVSTGLGLPIVKNLVELMGGTITVVSEFGHGTTFTINLKFPFAPKIPNEEKIESEEQRIRNIQEALRGRKILLVEDNEINLEIGQRILEMYGMICIGAENGAMALKRFKDSNLGEFDAILMDLNMPVLDGFQATELIRALKRPDAEKIPIIAMTADAFEETAEAIHNVGMNAHLTKPIDPEKLLEVLDKFID